MSITENICKIPVVFQQRDDISVYELFRKSGYLENPEDINALSIKQYIEKHSELISVWLAYSQDQRCTPA